MAAIFANSQRIDIGEGINIGDVKSGLAQALSERGFADIVHNASEVAGNRNGVRASVLFLFIGGRSFWQVVMAGGMQSTRPLSRSMRPSK